MAISSATGNCTASDGRDVLEKGETASFPKTSPLSVTQSASTEFDLLTPNSSQSPETFKFVPSTRLWNRAFTAHREMKLGTRVVIVHLRFEAPRRPNGIQRTFDFIARREY